MECETGLAGLLDKIRAGDALSIARGITAIENATPLGAGLRLAVRGASSRCRTLGVTGPPGAGKSSLISALISILIGHHPRIGVLTVDPSSPVSGGAVLGDRVRMAAHSRNPSVFIRSLAARGHLGGVTRTTRGVIDILATAGVDLIIVETVGTGQSEVAVAALADVKVVVCPPGLGDDMQAIKAGILEIADLLVVNKADLPDAGRTAGHLKTMLHYGGHDEKRSVLLASATTGEGLERLADMINALFSVNYDAPSIDNDIRISRDTLADEATDLFRTFILSADLDELCEAVGRGETTLRDGATTAVRLFVDTQGPKQ